MTLHKTLTASTNRDFHSGNPYPKEGELWTAWNNGCITCHEPFEILISSCETGDGKLYGFHPGKCFERHILEYWHECCQYEDCLRQTSYGQIDRRLRMAKDFLQREAKTIGEVMDISSLYHRSKMNINPDLPT